MVVVVVGVIVGSLPGGGGLPSPGGCWLGGGGGKVVVVGLPSGPVVTITIGVGLADGEPLTGGEGGAGTIVVVPLITVWVAVGWSP